MADHLTQLQSRSIGTTDRLLRVAHRDRHRVGRVAEQLPIEHGVRDGLPPLHRHACRGEVARLQCLERLDEGVHEAIRVDGHATVVLEVCAQVLQHLVALRTDLIQHGPQLLH